MQFGVGDETMITRRRTVHLLILKVSAYLIWPFSLFLLVHPRFSSNPKERMMTLRGGGNGPTRSEFRHIFMGVGSIEMKGPGCSA